jgi:hypothetical protein
MENEGRFVEIEHHERDKVLYEVLREGQGKRQNRFIAILLTGSENYQVSVTELQFFLTDGIATDMRGSMPGFAEPLRSSPTWGQAEAEAKILFDDYLEQGWLNVVEY